MRKRNFLLSILVVCVGLTVPRTLRAQQVLGVSLPAPLAASWSDTIPVDTFVTPFVATRDGLITTWEAQFYNVIYQYPVCQQPVGMQLKVLRPTGTNTLTVVSAGSVFDPLALLQARFSTPCPGYGDFTEDASSVFQFTEPVSLPVLQGDIIGFTVWSNPSSGVYALPWTSRSASNTTVLVGQTAPVGGTVNLTGGWLQSGLVNEIQVPQPSPVLVFLGTVDSGGYTYYNLSVSNWQLYSPELFVLNSTYGSCSDSDPIRSRTSVDIFDDSDLRIAGFCAFEHPQDLTTISFAEALGTLPPTAVYVVLSDYSTTPYTTYKSILLPIGPTPTPNGYSPIAVPLSATGGTNLYPFTGEVPPFTPNVFNYKVTYPALSEPPANLVVQPILISQADLDALVVGTPFQGVQFVPYDETGGFGVLFRATCQDSSGNPVTCPLTTGPHDVKTSWNSPSGQTISNPAFLMAPVGTHAWQNIFTALSETRIDPTGSGRTPPTYSDFVFVQQISGTPPTINITTPGYGAVYAINENVLAVYDCGPSPGVTCLGAVPQNSPIDTSSLGSKTFEVNAIVSSGPSADKSVSYTVAGYNTDGCLLYDPTRSVKKGATFPIKLQVCDAAGHNLSSPSIVVHAVSVTILSGGAAGALEDSGNANPDSDFRFDSTLGVGGGYIFNLSTKGLSSGTWRLNFTITGDPSTHWAKFGVK